MQRLAIESVFDSLRWSDVLADGRLKLLILIMAITCSQTNRLREIFQRCSTTFPANEETFRCVDSSFTAENRWKGRSNPRMRLVQISTGLCMHGRLETTQPVGLHNARAAEERSLQSLASRLIQKNSLDSGRLSD